MTLTKNCEHPRTPIGSNQVKDRDQESTSGSKILSRTLRDQPDNENLIRGIVKSLSDRFYVTDPEGEAIIESVTRDYIREHGVVS